MWGNSTPRLQNARTAFAENSSTLTSLAVCLDVRCVGGQVYTASIPALTLEHADISDPSSVPVRLNARNGRVQAASVQGALAAASADSSSGEPGAGAPASSRRLHVWQVCASCPLMT